MNASSWRLKTQRVEASRLVLGLNDQMDLLFSAFLILDRRQNVATDLIYYDSTGREIVQGDRVRFRGKEYQIKGFRPGLGRSGIAALDLDPPPDTPETPDEWSVDKLS